MENKIRTLTKQITRNNYNNVCSKHIIHGGKESGTIVSTKSLRRRENK